jgi:hypothetical protein
MGQVRENWDNLKDPRMIAFISVAVMGSLICGAAIFGIGFTLGGGGKASKAASPPPPPPPDAKGKKK